MINFPFKVSQKVQDKLLKKHHLTLQNVLNAFENRIGNLLIDEREGHATNPPSNWFVSELDDGRLIKVVYMQKESVGIVIKTAYVANADEIKIYNAKALP